MDSALCLIALAGMGLSETGDLSHIRAVAYVASDFKTLYASAALYARGANPYNMQAIAGIFRQQGMVEPGNWFGHAAVYPPVTLLLIAPLTRLSLAHAAWVFLWLSVALAALGLAMLLAEARAEGLGWGWRLGIIAAAASWPLVGFGLNIGNVSVAAAGLTTAACMGLLRVYRRAESPLKVKSWGWGASGALLGVALCLKPHMAIWVALGMALACGRTGRRAAGLAIAAFCLAFAVSGVWIMPAENLIQNIHSYMQVIHSETAAGSMSAGSREVLPVAAQIVSVESLTGFWFAGWRRTVLSGTILLVLAAALITAAAKSRWLFKGRADALLFLSATAAAGLIAMYHRSPDGLMLMPLLIFVCSSLRTAADRQSSLRARVPAAARALMLLGCVAGFSCDVHNWSGVLERVGVRSAGLADFLTLRQSALFASLLAAGLALLACLAARDGKKRRHER